MQGSVTVSFISWMERCQVLYQVLWKPSEKFHHRKGDKKGRTSVQNKSIYCCCIPKPIGASSNSFVQKKSFLEISHNATYSIGRSQVHQFFKEYWGTTVHWGQKGSIHLHWVDILYWLCQKIHLFMLIHHCFCQYKCTGSPIKFWTTWKPHLGYFDHLETILGYLQLF